MPEINNKPYAHLANPRTFITLGISLVSCYLVFELELVLNNEAMLLGLIISFPLVFSLQSSFRRRDRALEYLSRFKAALNVVYRSIVRSKKFSEETRAEARAVVYKASENLVFCLRDDARTMDQVHESFDEIFYYIEEQGKLMSGNSASRVIRYMRDVYECGTYLLSLKRHRTITALRAFSFIFINLFPFMQAAVLYGSVGDKVPHLVIYVASFVTAFVLITMYNIQVQLEYPFDQIGLDDIHLEDFVFAPVTKPYPILPEGEKPKKKKDNASSGAASDMLGVQPNAWVDGGHDE